MATQGKQYVFLANTLSGISGGPIYIRNKSNFLKNKGWKVLVIDNTDIFDNPIVIEEFQSFTNNRFYELLFPPSWFTKKRRKQIIRKLLAVIKCKDVHEYVIESVQITLSLWGELLASELNCKHIIYDINENDIINDDELYNYISKKYIQNELFCISSKAVSNLFRNYGVKEDAGQHYWDAMVNNEVEDIPVKALEGILSDFKIGYFGRYKRFIPYLIDQVVIFSREHKDITIALVFLGITQKEISIGDLPGNLRCIFLGPMSPIPIVFFHSTDVVVATAGCAAISIRHAPLVISMSVEENSRVLGFLGRTTSSISFPSSFDTEIHPLTFYLERSLNGEAFSIPFDSSIGETTYSKKGYLYQEECVNNVSVPINVLSIRYVQNKSQFLMYILLKLGGVKIAYNLKRMSFKKRYKQ